MKRKLFWIIYFAVTILMIAVAALLMPEYIIFNWYSLFPVGYIAINILLAFFSTSNLRKKIWAWNMEHRRIHYWGGEINSDYCFAEKDFPYNEDYNKTTAKIFLLFLPFWFIFILFFINKAKIISGAIFFAFLCAELIHMCVDDANSAKKERQELEQELKKQVSREQEGRWK